ncbi:MAG: tRNA uridine-5-carboxymethylaminomethyl(34) synthesis GTPase MnmE [Bacilli bacterium]|nr:tRNA uridine-5-carboxymethylaminomethyl(34) synthesis GTPase MnmE [Bacilli bacterium]
MSNVIIALATPPLKGALAIIRLSGDGVFAMADSLFSKKVSGIERKTIFYGTIKNLSGKAIDQVVLLAYPGPKTMTGEDVVEVIPHGSMLIVNEIIEAFLGKGAVYASRGEFSSRAFYHGKMDLVEAEAVNDLINATTIEAKDLALKSLSGEASKLFRPIEKRISELYALIEVGIDYPEYTDIEEASEAKIASETKEIVSLVDELIQNGHEGRIVKEGVKIALVGEPNVGKSSLLNALLKEEKAIVSAIPGTTRDVVEGDLNIHGVAIHLLDTAGIHKTEDKIEEVGVKRSEKTIENADVVVLVHDGREETLSQQEKDIIGKIEGKPLIIAYNKEDLLEEKEDGKLYISASNGNIEPLKEAIFQALSLSEDAFSKPSLSNPRQMGLLYSIKENLTQAGKDAEDHLPMDLVSVSLEAAYRDAKALLGEEESADIEDEIFSRFCVGK